jgi:hypothetical protein
MGFRRSEVQILSPRPVFPEKNGPLGTRQVGRFSSTALTGTGQQATWRTNHMTQSNSESLFVGYVGAAVVKIRAVRIPATVDVQLVVNSATGRAALRDPLEAGRSLPRTGLTMCLVDGRELPIHIDGTNY